MTRTSIKWSVGNFQRTVSESIPGVKYAEFVHILDITLLVACVLTAGVEGLNRLYNSGAEGRKDRA